MASKNDPDPSVSKRNMHPAELIESALRKNPVLEKVISNKGVLKAMINAMRLETVAAKKIVIQEGSKGDKMFVCAEGELQVFNGTKVVKTIFPQEAFGELSLIYDAVRKGSVIAKTDCKLWVLKKADYLAIMKKYFTIDDEDVLALLKSVPVLKNLSDECLLNIRRSLKAECYPANMTIIREGDDGSEFYIITGGTVTVHVTGSDGKQKCVGKLAKGEFFGEQALIKNVKREASVTADHPGVECLILDRATFLKFLANMKQVQTLAKERAAITTQIVENNTEHLAIKLEDLEVKGIIGNGSSAEVQLVQCKHNPSLVFALKKIKKYYITEFQLKDYVFTEKEILLSCQSPFIIRLYKTFKDSKYLYFLMEPCLGGDVRFLMDTRMYFDENLAKFISACAVEGLAYLHSKGIIYRDLKTENMVFDSKGYVKLVDFGYSKKLKSGRTFTNLGTAAYMAPEVTLGTGYDRATDFWSLGVLIYELLTGNLPFGDDIIEEKVLEVKNIKNTNFPPHMSKRARSIIKKLCNQTPNERLGYTQGIDEIRKHAWFSDFSWSSLQDLTMKAPYIPHIQSATDCSNFQHCIRDKEIAPDDCGGWDKDF